MKSFRCHLAAFTLLWIAFTPALAQQSWPAKPIRLIVASSAGSGVDVIARIYAPKLAEALGQPLVTENRVSATGIVALEALMAAPPDGYTLVAASGAFIVIGPSLYKLSVDVARDVIPIAPTGRTRTLLVSRPGLPVRNIAEFIAYARANPGKLNYGSAGIGTLPHIQAEMLLHAAKIRATHVPYKDVGRSMIVDMSGDRVDFAFDSGVALPFVQSGKLRLLAVVDPERSPLFPDTPTLAEAGLDVTGSIPQGVYGRSGTPREIVTRLHGEITRIVHSPEVVSALGKIRAEPTMSKSAEAFAASVQHDRERFAAIVREANIHVE